MKVPNNQKATKIKALNDKVEILGTAFTSYINEIRHLTNELQSLGLIVKNMPGFQEAVEKLQEDLKKSKEEAAVEADNSKDFDFGDEGLTS